MYIFCYHQGKSEFIGRALARPHIKLREEVYQRPHLEWHDLYRGTDHAGELLATFELLQVGHLFSLIPVFYYKC